MVIFVHELGHFLVAKACGVKCEKFYLGFDIYGLKICKFRWGETEKDDLIGGAWFALIALCIGVNYKAV